MYSFNQENRREWVQGIAAAIPKGQTILDAGAGSGQYRPFFSHCNYMTHDFGCEVGTIGKYTTLDYESDITAIPAESGKFDAILCTEVIEHVPQPILAVKELARLLKPGGKLYITAPLGSFLHQEPFHFYGGYTPYWYTKFFEESGLKVVSIERNMGFFSFLAQESQRFSAILAPWRSIKQAGVIKGVAASLIWLITLPFARFIVPLCAKFLDSLSLEKEATVGYHVIGEKL